MGQQRMLRLFVDEEDLTRDEAPYLAVPMETEQLFREISRYVAEAAWGAAALINKGLMPPVNRPFSGSVTAALKASKPDRERILLAIGRARADGSLVGQTTAERARKEKHTAEFLRARLEQKLDIFNDNFSECARVLSSWQPFPLTPPRFSVQTADKMLERMAFPRDTTIHTLAPATIDRALANVKPLSPAASMEAQDASSLPSLALLEEFRVRGEEIRNVLAMEAREEAMAAFTRAGTLMGDAQATAYALVLEKFEVAASCSEHGAVSNTNMAAAALKQKE